MGSRPEGNLSALDTQKNILPFLRKCASLAPSFLSLGNHEHYLDEKDLNRIRETGVKVLDNSYEKIMIEDKCYVFGGLTSAQVIQYRSDGNSIPEEDGGTDRYPIKDPLTGKHGCRSGQVFRRRQDGLRILACRMGTRFCSPIIQNIYPLCRTPLIWSCPGMPMEDNGESSIMACLPLDRDFVQNGQKVCTTGSLLALD